MKTIHLKILTINLLSGSTGSARIASDIQRGVHENQAHTTYSIVGYQKQGNKQEISIFHEKPMSFWYYFWVVLNFFFEVFRPGQLNGKTLRTLTQYTSSNILHLHTIQGGYFDYRDLPKISKQKKVIWTLHDDWFCAGNDTDNSLFPYKTKNSYLERKKIFEQTDTEVVAVSDWMYQKALRSEMFPKEKIHKIHNGIDTSVFYPRGKLAAREKLGISEDVFMVVAIAGAGRKSKLKGIHFIERLAKEVRKKAGIQFFTLGNKNENTNGNITEVPFVSSEEMALYFSAADVFLYPTSADSFGLVVAESIASGCPIIAFDVGAISELVIPKKTGFLVPFGDYQELKKAFFQLQESPFSLTKEDIPFDISTDRMAREYIQLYQKVLS